MNAVPVDRLESGQGVHRDLHDPTGEVLLSKGTRLDLPLVQVLRTSGIGILFERDPREELETFRKRLSLEPIDLEKIQPVGADGRTGADLVDANGILLVKTGTDWSASLRDRLLGMGKGRVFRRAAAPSVDLSDLHAKVRGILEGREKALLQGIARCGTESLSVASIGEKIRAGGLEVAPTGEPLAVSCVGPILPGDRSESDARRAVEVHGDLREGAAQLLGALRSRQEYDADRIGAAACRIVREIVADRDLLLQTVYREGTVDSLSQHAVDTAILGSILGAALGFGQTQVVEIAFGGFFANVGMLGVPDEIIRRKGPLTAQQRETVRRHPEDGLHRLRSVRGLPASTPVIAYQHHEQPDGNGYPLGTVERSIHTYARIVRVADVYTALVRDRPWRVRMRPDRAVTELMKMQLVGKIDRAATRGLLHSIGIYPIGLRVRLDDGQEGGVIQNDGENVDRPLLWIDRRGGETVEGAMLDLRECAERYVQELLGFDEGILDQIH